MIVSHIGSNPETQRAMLEGEIAVDRVPEGTLAERVRAGGSGLGGVLTATGLGTVVAEGKAVVMVGGHECLVGEALRAVTLIVTEMAVIEPSSEGLIRRE